MHSAVHSNNKMQKLQNIFSARGFHQPGNNRLTYISSMRREDAINVMKEWLIKCGAAEDWMKHLK